MGNFVDAKTSFWKWRYKFQTDIRMRKMTKLFLKTSEVFIEEDEFEYFNLNPTS